MKRIFTFLLLLVIFLSISCEKRAFIIPTPKLIIEKYYTGSTLSISFDAEYEVISKWTKILYRNVGSNDNFTESPIQFTGLHDVVYNPNDGNYYGVDSDEGVLVVISDFDDSLTVKEYSTIAGVELVRPHDLEFDHLNEVLYLLDANNGNTFKFPFIEENEEVFSMARPGYFRSIHLMGDRPFITNCKPGELIEITNFEKNEVLVHPTYLSNNTRAHGSWETDGLKINDIHYFEGYWYLSNSFNTQYDLNAETINKNKLIQFQTLHDLAIGNWTDISSLVEDTIIPYNFSEDELGNLYLTSYTDGNADSRPFISKITSLK